MSDAPASQPTDASSNASNEAVRASIGWPILAMLLMCTMIFGMLSGAIAAWYVVMSTPMPPTIAIVDSDAMLRQALTLDPSNPKAAADRVLAQTRVRVANLVAQGIIVLDRSAIIDAPVANIVRADFDPASTVDATEAPTRKHPLDLLRSKERP